MNPLKTLKERLEATREKTRKIKETKKEIQEQDHSTITIDPATIEARRAMMMNDPSVWRTW